MTSTSPDLPLALAPKPAPVEMRDYQRSCIDAVHASLVEYDRALVVMATGSGKSLVFAKLAQDCIQQRGSFCVAAPRVLLLVNREELLLQAAAQIQRVSGVYVSIERASSQGSVDAPIVVATIQTLQRRMEKYPVGHFGLVIIDESHQFTSPSITKVIDQLCYPDGAKLVGFTATPQTKGKRALSKIYETIAYEKGIGSLISEKWLCNLVVRTVPIKIDLSAVRSKAGDYMDDDLDAVITPYFTEIAKAMKEHGTNRKWLCFLPLIRTSEHFTSILNSHGIAAQHIDGTSDDRREILLAFRAGKFQSLQNSILLSTGFDEPSITGIVNLRPTQSRILLQQIIGRGTRIKPEDSAHDDCLILDPLWQNAELSELVSPASLFAASEEDEKETAKRLKKGEQVDLMATHEAVVADRHAKLAEALKANEGRTGKLLDFAAMLNLGIQKNDLFTAVLDYEPTMKWHSKRPTHGQLNALSKMGIDMRIIKDMGHASYLMAFCVDRIRRGLCTFKQANALHRAGIKLDFDKLTMREASERIGKLYNR